MKTLNWKVAVLTFTAFTIIDAVLLSFALLPWSGGKWLMVAYWITNLPSYPLVMILTKILPAEPIAWIPMFVCAGLFGSLFWAALSGFIFRHKNVA
jgi:hypothetical protein